MQNNYSRIIVAGGLTFFLFNIRSHFVDVIVRKTCGTWHKRKFLRAQSFLYSYSFSTKVTFFSRLKYIFNSAAFWNKILVQQSL